MEADDPRRPARKSAPGQPWSHAETMHLIDVYEDHWTKLRRGQLKAQQWEEVAAEVTHRCGPGQRKTGTQCRHKLEKLRKRYRTEGARPLTSLWPFFRRMEQLERGPLPSATTVSSSFAASPPAASDEDQEEDQEDEDEEQDEEEEDQEEEDEEEEEEQLLVARNSTSSHTRSISGLMRDAGGFRGHQLQHHQHQQRRPSPPAVTLSTAPPRKRVSYEAAMFQSKASAAAESRVKVEEEAPAVNRHSIAGVLRDIGEGIKQLERRRMEVQWEIERAWKETEARHNRMIQDAQRQFEDALAALPPPAKKARRDHGGSADSL